MGIMRRLMMGLTCRKKMMASDDHIVQFMGDHFVSSGIRVAIYRVGADP